MDKNQFRTMVENKIVLLDGATGSNLQKRGMPTGVCPELWISEHPEVLQQLQKEYVEAGSDIVYAPTFSGNRIKMSEYGLGDRLEEINTKLVQISKEGVEGKALVAADITMTGAQLEPLGDLSFQELVDVYKEQLTILEKAGVDLIVVETMMSLQETRAAVIAAKEVCPNLPIMATLSFTESGKTLYGAAADAAVVVLQNLGVDAVGMNCSAGPDKMVAVLDMMTPVARIPLIAKPNAGLPKLSEDGMTTTYDMDAETFASYMKEMAAHGAAILGGCCGSAPEFIAKTKQEIADCAPKMPTTATDKIYLSTERQVFAFEQGQEIDLGEGIDFSKDEDLVEEYQNDEFDTATDLAFDLMDDEVDALCIRADKMGEKEADILLKTANSLVGMIQLPIVFATAKAAVAEAVLHDFSGSAAILCLSEDENEKKLIKYAGKAYGAGMVTIDKKIISC